MTMQVEHPDGVRLDRLLTLAQTAEVLGKTRTALEWQVARGTAPRSALINGRRMFKAADVQAFIDAHFEASA